MEHLFLHITILSLILFAGVELNRFSRFLKMPILICFLGIGIVCGPHGIDILGNFDMQKVQTYGEIAICYIIFAGGLQTSFQSIKKVFVTGTILANAGVFLTAILCALFLWWISHLSLFMTCTFAIALMAAATFASTDAAAVFAILRGQKARIRPELQGLLEYESGSNDPAAFLLTSVMIPIAFSQQTTSVLGISWSVGTGIAWGLGAGTVIGFLTGLFGLWFYNHIHSFLEYNGLRFVIAIAIVLFCYGIARLCWNANPLMACYVAGITMGNIRFSFKHTFIKFHDGFSWLMQILLFTILGAFFDYHMLFNLRNMVGVILIALFLTFIARPVVVMICMIRSPFTIRERIFTSWVGIRGSAPIMLAAMVAAAAPPELSKFGSNLFYGVFTLVLFSILFQGATLMWLAKKLGLVLPYEEEQEDILECDERPDGRELWKFTISKDNCYVGKTLTECRAMAIQSLTDAGITDMPILLMIQRKKEMISPDSRVILQADDTLTLLGKRDALSFLQQNFVPESENVPSWTFTHSDNYSKEARIIHDVLNKFKSNTDIQTVAMKIAVIDVTNSTHLSQYKSFVSLYSLAKKIVNIRDFDKRVSQGDLDLVKLIADNRTINLFSFASKYCTYHNVEIYQHDDYSIFDGVVKKVLPHYIRGLKSHRIERWRQEMNYRAYNECIGHLLNENHINIEFRRRKIDHFLWYLNRKKQDE